MCDALYKQAADMIWNYDFDYYKCVFTDLMPSLRKMGGGVKYEHAF